MISCTGPLSPPFCTPLPEEDASVAAAEAEVHNALRDMGTHMVLGATGSIAGTVAGGALCAPLPPAIPYCAAAGSGLGSGAGEAIAELITDGEIHPGRVLFAIGSGSVMSFAGSWAAGATQGARSALVPVATRVAMNGVGGSLTSAAGTYVETGDERAALDALLDWKTPLVSIAVGEAAFHGATVVVPLFQQPPRLQTLATATAAAAADGEPPGMLLLSQGGHRDDGTPPARPTEGAALHDTDPILDTGFPAGSQSDDGATLPPGKQRYMSPYRQVEEDLRLRLREQEVLTQKLTQVQISTADEDLAAETAKLQDELNRVQRRIDELIEEVSNRDKELLPDGVVRLEDIHEWGTANRSDLARAEPDTDLRPPPPIAEAAERARIARLRVSFDAAVDELEQRMAFHDEYVADGASEDVIQANLQAARELELEMTALTAEIDNAMKALRAWINDPAQASTEIQLPGPDFSERGRLYQRLDFYADELTKVRAQLVQAKARGAGEERLAEYKMREKVINDDLSRVAHSIRELDKKQGKLP